MKLLAILPEAAAVAACLDATVAAARVDRDATIETLHVVVDPDKLIRASEEIEIQRLRERNEGTANERAEAAHAAVVQWQACAPADAPSIAWNAVTGAEEENVQRAAADADLIVLAHGRDLDSGDALHAAVFSCERPVLLVPAAWRAGPEQRFEKIVIGLSDSDAARRAIAAANRWLTAAGEVIALRIGANDDEAISLVHLIAEESVTPQLHVVPAAGGDLGAQIVAEADQLGADLLVSGAYRHAQIIEWLVGGTTRHMLAAANLPMLLAH